MKQTWVAASWIAFSILTASAQGTADKPDTPEFEVASVKPAGPQERGPLASFMAEMMGFDGGPGTQDPGRIRYHDVTLKALLARAYKVKPGEISGPGWLGSERYTIEAKLPRDTDGGRLRLMLQKLLTERFEISLHREVKETPVYRLKVAKNGPKLKPAEKLPELPQDKDERQEAMRQQAEENLAKAIAAREANARMGIRGPSRSFGLARATTARFAEVLSSNLDRPVKDMTQLEGEYSFHLEWTPDSGMHDDSSGVSIFTAIQEQLGLRLEAGNEAIELLVIDKAEKVPTSN